MDLYKLYIEADRDAEITLKMNKIIGGEFYFTIDYFEHHLIDNMNKIYSVNVSLKNDLYNVTMWCDNDKK